MLHVPVGFLVVIEATREILQLDYKSSIFLKTSSEGWKTSNESGGLHDPKKEREVSDNRLIYLLHAHMQRKVLAKTDVSSMHLLHHT